MSQTWNRRQRALAALALLIIAGATGALTGCARSQAQKEADAARQKFVQQEVTAALDETDKLQKELHASLADPLRVSQLLSNLDQWQQRIQTARATWRRAEALAKAGADVLDKELAQRLEQTGTRLQADEKDYQLARQLEDVRLAGAVLVEGKLNRAAVEPKYVAVFRSAGFDLLKGDPAPLAAQIRRSSVRYVLVAALDHWAAISRDQNLPARLLELARLADPDPWRDQLRAAKNRQDRKTLLKLAEQVDVARQSPQSLLFLAERLQATGGGAAGLLRRALVHCPTDFWLHFYLGTLTKDPAEAAGYYRAALAIRPHSSVVYLNLGVTLADRKDLEGAVACLRKALQLDPNMALAHFQLGRIHQQQKDLAAALAHYRKAIQLQPDFAAAHLQLGTVLWEMKDLDGAIVAYQKTLALDPNNAPAHYHLGNALKAKGQLQEAIRHYEEALKLDPKFAPAHRSLGDTRKMVGDLDGAMSHYRKALELNPVDGWAWTSLGQALRTKGDMDGAAAAFHKAIQSDPRCVDAYDGLGLVLLDLRRLAEAEAVYSKLLELAPPGEARYLAHYGLVLQACGQPSKALAVLSKAAQTDPQNPRLHIQLGTILQTLGKSAEALAAFRKGIALEPNKAVGLPSGNRYLAARALLAMASEKAANKEQKDEQQRFRQQALEWLKAELTAWTREAAKGMPSAKALVQRTLTRWQKDGALAGVRDEQGLTQLPEAERQAWRQMWAEADALLKRS